MFKQAEQTLVELQKLHETYSDHPTIINYTQFAQATLFKFGSLKKKAKLW